MSFRSQTFSTNPLYIVSEIELEKELVVKDPKKLFKAKNPYLAQKCRDNI